MFASLLNHIGCFCFYFLCFFFFFFRLCLWHVELPGPGIEPVLQQWPRLLQWQHLILNPLNHRGTSVFSHFHIIVCQQKFLMLLKSYTIFILQSTYCDTELTKSNWSPNFFFGQAHRFRKFPGQGLNLCHSSDLRCCSDNVRSLACCATRELPDPLIWLLYFFSLFILIPNTIMVMFLYKLLFRYLLCLISLLIVII